MASRVALLILTIGMFAAVWSGDHPDQMAMIDRPTKVLVGQRKILQKEDIPSGGESVGERVSGLGSTFLESANLHLDAPLPDGISAGTFLIADQHGRTEIRVVTMREAFPGGKFRGRRSADHYEVAVDKQRWHYIRLDSNLQNRNSLSSAPRSTVQ